MKISRFSSRVVEDPREKAEITNNFVEPLYLRVYGTAPPIPDAYVVVEEGQLIRACLGIDWPASDGSLSIEKTYGINPMSYPVAISAENKIQFCRWASVEPNAGMVAVLRASEHCLALGRKFALLEQNETVHRRSRLIGLQFLDVEFSEIDLSLVRKENREFYARGSLKPYLLDLSQAASAMEKRLLRLKVQ